MTPVNLTSLSLLLARVSADSYAPMLRQRPLRLFQSHDGNDVTGASALPGALVQGERPQRGHPRSWDRAGACDGAAASSRNGGRRRVSAARWGRGVLPVERSGSAAMSEELGNVHIIVCDDDPEAAELAVDLLQDAGIGRHHTHVGSGGELMRTLPSVSHPKAVLLDIHMPGLDGHQVLRQIRQNPDTAGMKLGYFGASTGAAAELVAAAERPDDVGAVVSRGGRPDLAGAALSCVRAPTLLIVGGYDTSVIEINRAALAQLRGEKELTIVPDASHLFEEPGKLEQVARLAASWFSRYLGSQD